jgi:hypothetical protein
MIGLEQYEDKEAMKNKSLENYKIQLLENNLRKKLGSSENLSTLLINYENSEKNKVDKLCEYHLLDIQESRIQPEKLVGLEISLSGRLKGAAKARRMTTGLSGTLKPQTILGSEYYSISQRQVYTK